MKKKTRSPSPLLYVHQPKLNTPKAHMQQRDFSNKVQSQEYPQKTSKKKINQKKRMPINRVFPTQEDVDDEDEVTQQVNASDSEISEEQNEENKSFDNLSIQGKIAYLAREPKFISKIRCEIKTAEKTFRGTVHTYDDDIVYLQAGRRQTKLKIRFEDIKEINILGLKR